MVIKALSEGGESTAWVTLVIPGRSTSVRLTTWGENIFRWMGSSLIPCRGMRREQMCTVQLNTVLQNTFKELTNEIFPEYKFCLLALNVGDNDIIGNISILLVPLLTLQSVCLLLFVLLSSYLESMCQFKKECMSLPTRHLVYIISAQHAWKESIHLFNLHKCQHIERDILICSPSTGKSKAAGSAANS